jgi:membrane-associated PAP2 superfamily phosphatase
MGGHFLSDVTFSAIFMLLVAATIYQLMFVALPQWRERKT